MDTPSRRELLNGSPVVSVAWLMTGVYQNIPAVILSTVACSQYKSPNWKENLLNIARQHGHDSDNVLAQTDSSGMAEGIYVKIESDGQVQRRLKWVRSDFSNKIAGEDGAPSGHWLDRPHLPNLLADGVDIYR